MVSTEGAGAGDLSMWVASSFDHLRVRERIELRQAQQIVESHRCEAGRLDGFQVPAAALDVQDVLVLAEQVLFAPA